MTSISTFLPQAEQVAAVIDDLMIDELGLMAPASYQLTARDKRLYLVASYDPLMLGRSLRAYENPEIARRLRSALRMPVYITRETGTRYVVLMYGTLSLPKLIPFPSGYLEPNVFRLGVGLKGEIKLSARHLRNVMIGAGQGAGKSNVLDLLSYQMGIFGWELYLADPQSHTFNPDVWNGIGVMSVAGSHADMLKVIDALESELADRIQKFRMSALDGVIPADVDDYNLKSPQHGGSPLARIGFLIDEANYFMGHKIIFGKLAELLRQGRKWGLHIVLAAHEWHKENVPAAVNDLIQTRIALSSLSGAVVLRSNRWGKWAEGRPPGRGVLKTNTFEPMQFYLMEKARLNLPKVEAAGAWLGMSPIPEREAELVRKALAEAEGRMTMSLLIGWGMSQDEARELGARYERRGWLAKDPLRGNARFVTDGLVAIVEKFATNPQTPQTAQTAVISPQTVHQPSTNGHKLPPTPNLASA
jgi:hypothetical protein